MVAFIETQRRIYEGVKDTFRVTDLNVHSPLEIIVSSERRVLYPIIDANDVIVISGAYFGDEAKGKMTDAVAKHPLIVLIARMNSGENAGHTVWHDGVKYIFHLAPSGLLVPNKICAIGPECVMDPINFMQTEIQQLVDHGFSYMEKLFIGNCHLVGPHHKILDFALSPLNSSTMTGMSWAHASKALKKGLRLNNIYNSRQAQEAILKDDLNLYFALMQHNGKDEATVLSQLRDFSKERPIPQHLFDFLETRDKVGFVLDLYHGGVVQNPNFPHRANITHMIRQILEERRGKVLLESPQSYWLSNEIEVHFPSSTSAHTHALGVLSATRINPRYRAGIINVAKTPGDSRVGRGANPSSFVPQNYFAENKIGRLDKLGDKCSDFDAIQRMYFDAIQENGILRPTTYTDSTGTYSVSEAMAIASARKFGEKGSTTGKPRVTGVFDCVAAYQVCKDQGPYLSLSAMDRGDFQDFVGMTVAYVYFNPNGDEAEDSNGIKYKNGDIIKIGDPYPDDNVLKYCQPIIKKMKGWKDTPISPERGYRRGSDLPSAVTAFISEVERLTGFEVISIGNGPNTEDMIYVKQANWLESMCHRVKSIFL